MKASETPAATNGVKTRLWNALLEYELAAANSVCSPLIRLRRKVLLDLKISWEDAETCLKAWYAEGYWDYGADLEYGWLTPQGLARGRL